jgi:hypothetical protein
MRDDLRYTGGAVAGHRERGGRHLVVPVEDIVPGYATVIVSKTGERWVSAVSASRAVASSTGSGLAKK